MPTPSRKLERLSTSKLNNIINIKSTRNGDEEVHHCIILRPLFCYSLQLSTLPFIFSAPLLALPAIILYLLPLLCVFLSSLSFSSPFILFPLLHILFIPLFLPLTFVLCLCQIFLHISNFLYLQLIFIYYNELALFK